MFRKIILISVPPFIFYLGVGIYFQKEFSQLIELSIMFTVGSYFLINIITHLIFSKKKNVQIYKMNSFSTFGTTGGKVFSYGFKDVNSGEIYHSKYHSNQVIDDKKVVMGFVYQNKIVTTRNILLVMFLSLLFISASLYILIRVL